MSSSWPHYQTPILMHALAPYLDSYPDKAFAQYIREGLAAGFRIGFTRERQCLHSNRRNHPSASAKQGVVFRRISEELAAGRLLGPIPPSQWPGVHSSPLGLVPKPHQPNRWRMICDLSSPKGSSVNDGIPSHLCSLKYSSVDDAVTTIQQLGKGTQLVKLDIKDAYRIVPVHPADYHLLGITWQGKLYIDRALPFGLRSAPKIFNAIADFVAWVLASNGISYLLHYLDDFLFMAAPLSPQGAVVLDLALKTLQRLGIPVAVNKTEGPTTMLIFLGILIDTVTFELRLPAEKLSRLKEMVTAWAGKQYCTRRDLESLLGHLSHAATVIRQGRVFLRQLFPLLALDRAPHHFLRLNAGAKADLLWWKTFLTDWNGCSFFPSPIASIEIVSDASGTFGCGAFSSGCGWFQLQWPEDWAAIHITAKELVPIVVAAAIWGHTWTRKRVRFVSDNMAVVALLNSRTSSDTLLMHLLRCLTFYAAFFKFELESAHIPGTDNTAADAISRNNITLFHSLVPHISQVTIPQTVIDLLVTRRPDWGSDTWTHLFRSTLARGSHNQPEQSTAQVGEST